MYPIIYRLGPLTIYSYGLMVVLAFSIATFLTAREGKKQGLNPELILDFCFIALLGGIIGARILYVILNLNYYFNNPIQIVMLNRGGLAWFGGLILASLSCVIYLRYKHLDVYRIFDLTVPYVALGQSIGRIGCFLNGCCFGKETAYLGIYFPVHHATLIPTQLYSSLALLIIYSILRIKQVQAQRKGQILYLYLFLYSLWRFFIEFFRGDSEIFVFNLSIFQLASVVLFVLSGVMLIRIRRQTI